MLEKVSMMKYGVLLRKRVLLLTIIFSVTFYTSYFVFSYYFPQYFIQSASGRLAAQISFNIVIAIALIGASFFINKFSKLRVIYACSIATFVFVVLFFVLGGIFRLICISLIALFFSVAQLSFLTYFWNLTVPEERGRIAGLLGCFSIIFYIIMYVTVTQSIDVNKIAVLGVILSLTPTIGLVLKPVKDMVTDKKNERGFSFEKRTILLYLIPWALFSLINATLARNISFHNAQQFPTSLYTLLVILQGIGTLFGSLIGGLTADFLGRRASLSFSLTLYGISSAVAGIANYSLMYFVYFANGLSWGILLAMYTFVIWGDLSNERNCAKMYAIGFTIFYLTQGLGLLPVEQIFQIPLAVSSLGSCLLIFLSNIPIFLAPELLSSSFREKIRLRMHINATKKIKRSRNQG